MSATQTESATKTAAAPPVSDEKPTDAVLQEVLARQVKDQDGKEHTLKSLIVDDSQTTRTVVVFIRHFFCSFCQEYVRSLTRDLPPSKLSALTPPARLIIVGHGDPALIRKYVADTGSAFPIYADSGRAVYDKLGFVSNLSGVLSTRSPGYVRRGRPWLALSTARQYLFGGARTFFGSGKPDQNGGELVFGPAGDLVFFRRMRNTADHVEPEDLEKILMA